MTYSYEFHYFKLYSIIITQENKNDIYDIMYLCHEPGLL